MPDSNNYTNIGIIIVIILLLIGGYYYYKSANAASTANTSTMDTVNQVQQTLASQQDQSQQPSTAVSNTTDNSGSTTSTTAITPSQSVPPSSVTAVTMGSQTTVPNAPNPVAAVIPIATYPTGLTDGEIVNCAGNNTIWKLQNSQKRWFSPAAYSSAGSPIATSVACNTLQSIPIGPDMSQASTSSQANAVNYPSGMTEGEIIRCATTGGIYQLANGFANWYPTPAIYTAHGSPAYTDVDCNLVSMIPYGTPFS